MCARVRAYIKGLGGWQFLLLVPSCIVVVDVDGFTCERNTGQHRDQHTTRNLKRAKYGFNYGSALYTRLRGAVGGSSTTP